MGVVLEIEVYVASGLVHQASSVQYHDLVGVVLDHVEHVRHGSNMNLQLHGFFRRHLEQFRFLLDQLRILLNFVVHLKLSVRLEDYVRFCRKLAHQDVLCFFLDVNIVEPGDVGVVRRGGRR